MTLGLYGGSFDPVHIGHLLVAQAAVEEMKLDRLFFIPAAQSPFKPNATPAPAAARLRWLRLALAGRSEFEVDDQEVHRGGVSYSVDTAQSYRARFPKARLLWLIGADHLPSLPLWRRATDLATLVEFIVIPRPNEKHQTLPGPFVLHHLDGWPIRVSASEIRERIRAGRRVDHLLPPSVAEAIARESAYL